METAVSLLKDTHTDTSLLSSASVPCDPANGTGRASIRHYGICLQGFLVGLCLEGALALCLCALYRIAYASR